MILKIEKKCWLLLAIVVCITSFTGIETVYAVNKTAVTSRESLSGSTGVRLLLILYQNLYLL